MFDGVDRCELAQLDESRQVAHLLEGGVGNTIVACAGTSDLFAAEEAAVTARIAGSSVTLITDIGIAGIHRTLAHESELRSARAIAVAAGMEGALPSVIAGLVDVPVIAIPTSVGYGASLGGIAALLGMLNSCAGGVSVVNIDNGFGAGQILDRINRPPARFAGVR
jgi:NCAIR mutase (PurE)-related protein